MNELMQEYMEWVLEQDVFGLPVSRVDEESISIDAGEVTGWVNAYEINGFHIAELRINRTDSNEELFFLHFELDDLTRAQALFFEMTSALHDIVHQSITHILLSCTCGMTTGFFALKLNEAAKEMGIAFDFEAQRIQDAKQNGTSYAAVLLAPQVASERKEVAQALPGIPVMEIPAKMFATYDVYGVFRLLLGTVGGARPSHDHAPQLQVKQAFDPTLRILALSYVHREDEPTLGYRVLDHGELTTSGMLVAHALSTKTLDRLSARLRIAGYDISEFDAVGIAVPGVVHDGMLIERYDGERAGLDLIDLFSKRWDAKVFVDYNACAAAVGCFVSQDEYQNVAFHAQAVGVVGGEEGYVVNGRPVIGLNGRSGHLGPLSQTFTLGMDAEDAAWRVYGICELVGRYIASLACTLAPDVVYVWCDILPDMEELREELQKTLPDAAIPKLVSVSNYDDCILTGELALCAQHLKDA